MSENPIAISKLNDFIFCPVSIYFHDLDIGTDRISIQDEYQLNGSAAHEKVDNAEYSSRALVLQAIPVFSEKYNFYGKIDTFDISKGILTERKKKIRTVYDGYVFQLFAQYFALSELGYSVKQIRLYSMDDNKIYSIKTPEENPEMLEKFEKLLDEISGFTFEGFRQTNSEKCARCIYEPLCSFSAKEVAL